jgi:hypothetical protein
MVVPLAASAAVLFWAAKRYPTDVATAGLVTGPAGTGAERAELADGAETAGTDTTGSEQMGPDKEQMGPDKASPEVAPGATGPETTPKTS